MATAKSRLQILIDVATGDSKKELTGLQKTMGNFTDGIGKVTAGLTSFAIVTKQVFEFGKEGAELDLLASKFDNVATHAGFVADALLSDMRAATGGMVDNAELMRSATDIIELGLANTQDGVVDLAEAISVLGLDMQQVILTFANDSTARLDSLGLSVEKVTKRAQELKDEGFTGDAFDQAVIEGLQERMLILGDVTESTQASFARMETALANVADVAKTKFSPAIANAADAVFYLLEGQNLLSGALISSEQNILKNTSDWDDYAVGVLDALVSSGRMTKASRDLAEENILLGRSFEDLHLFSTANTDGLMMLSKSAFMYGRRVTEADYATSGFYRTQQTANETIEESNTTTTAAGTALENFYAKLNRGFGSQTRWQRITSESVEAQEESVEAQEEYNEELATTINRLAGVDLGIRNTLKSLQDQIAFLRAGGGQLVTQADEIRKAYSAGLIDADTAEEELQRLQMGAIDLDLELENITTHEAVRELTAMGVPLSKAWDTVEEMQNSLFRLARTYDVTIRYRVEGDPTSGRFVPPAIGRDAPAIMAANGLSDFVVPPGFPNDSFPINVTSGETVNVSPRGQPSGGDTRQMDELLATMRGLPSAISDAVRAGVQMAQ